MCVCYKLCVFQAQLCHTRWTFCWGSPGDPFLDECIWWPDPSSRWKEMQRQVTRAGPSANSLASLPSGRSLKMTLNRLNTFPKTSRLAFNETTGYHTLTKPSQIQFRVRSSRERQLCFRGPQEWDRVSTPSCSLTWPNACTWLKGGSAAPATHISSLNPPPHLCHTPLPEVPPGPDHTYHEPGTVLSAQVCTSSDPPNTSMT